MTTPELPLWHWFAEARGGPLAAGPLRPLRRVDTAREVRCWFCGRWTPRSRYCKKCGAQGVWR